MASADSEGLLPSAQLFPTGRICFLPLPRKDSVSGKPGVPRTAVFLESSTNFAIGQHKLQVLQAWTNPLHLFGLRDWTARGWWRGTLRDDAETATGGGMMLKQLREHSSLLQKRSSCRASPCPWEGLTDPSHTKGVSLWCHLACLGARWGVLLQLGDSQELCFGEPGRDCTASVCMDRSRLRQWLSLHVDTSDYSWKGEETHVKHGNSNRLLSGLSNRNKFGACYLSLIAGSSLNLLLY